jgi:sulfatase modifying factor 1
MLEVAQHRATSLSGGKLKDRRARVPTKDLVWVPGGTFLMGSDVHYPEEAPAHKVSVSGFWIEATPVTNRAFAKFIGATGYVTLAERMPDVADYPGAPPETLIAASAVFTKPPRDVDRSNAYNWWSYVAGANWKRPRGLESTIDGLDDHPVVHIAYEDAETYARWAGLDLPTEAEFEFAARGGLEGMEFVWGSEMRPGGRIMANTWQGEFPWHNSLDDGFEWTSPVRSFPPNGFGLYDMAGNVWQWTSDWYQDHRKIDSPCCTLQDPKGGCMDGSYDPADDTIRHPRKVLKGGSYLCAPNYCQRYRPAARLAQTIDTTTCHVGFRCVSRVSAT